LFDVVNSPFIDDLKQLCSKWLLGRGCSLNPVGRIKNEDAQWIVTAWRGVMLDVMVKG
jgi:hypothetical protein